MERAADLALHDPHVVLQLRHMLFGGRLFRERPWQHELGFEHRAAGIDETVKGRSHPFDHGMLHPPLKIFDGIAGVSLVPAPIELFGHGAELNNQNVGKILRLGLATLLAPKLQQFVLSSPIMIRASEPPTKYRRSNRDVRIANSITIGKR